MVTRDKKKILVVDDEQALAEVVKLRLEASGYEVSVAFDGREGLEKARNEMPDLIILDVMLPKLDGFKICRILKFDEKYKHIPIFMFSARAQKTDMATGLETGADEYIVKPFEPKELLKKIEDYLLDKEPEPVQG